MDIYRYYAEDEKKRFIFYFSYKPLLGEIMQTLTDALGFEPYIYDIFPEPYTTSEVLEDLLSIRTASGKEMFIPAGLEVNYFDQCRILFGENNDEQDT